MRLLNTATFELKLIADPAQESFAILSHTWGEDEDEISLSDLENLDLKSHASGYAKLKKTCEIALAQGYQYVWIDTCCIDKTSSAELSEAINSMFQWYQKADLCYVFLADFDLVPRYLPETARGASQDARFGSCRWFARGWTLQELIAPRHMEFFDREWNYIGNKTTLLETLANTTLIPEEILQHTVALSDVPVARRMSWAANRYTTRIEDMAYCLLGIFDTNMPLLYGEGEKAFIRLQEQIAIQSNDSSLFAWVTTTKAAAYSGIFAESPQAFQGCRSLRRPRQTFFGGGREVEFTITSNGLQVSALLRGNILCLDCFMPKAEMKPLGRILGSSGVSEESMLWIVVKLEKVGSSYVRDGTHHYDGLVSRSNWYSKAERKSFTIRKQVPRTEDIELRRTLWHATNLDYFEVEHFIRYVASFPAHLWTCSFEGQVQGEPIPSTRPVSVHTFALKGEEHESIVVVSGHQPTNTQNLQEWCGIFALNSTTKTIPMLAIGGTKIGEAGFVEDIWDGIMLHYSDKFGSVDARTLPSSIELHPYRFLLTLIRGNMHITYTDL